MSHFYESQTPEDVPPSHHGEPVEDDLDSADEPSEDVDTGRFEESARYRDGLIDAGRGHLVRHL